MTTHPQSKRRVYIFVNGILNLPGAADSWTDRAVTWTHIHAPNAWGEKFEYLSGALTRWVKQPARAEKFSRMISHYDAARWDVNLVGHSNGCDIILRTLALLPKRYIEAIHLIAAACEADFSDQGNGLNTRLASGYLGRVFAYVGGQDKALSVARLTQWLRFAGLGYGTMGKTGPINASANERVHLTYQADFGHSTWFEVQHFHGTMRRVTGYAGS